MLVQPFTDKMQAAVLYGVLHRCRCFKPKISVAKEGKGKGIMPQNLNPPERRLVKAGEI